jgi:hypothetical protein
MDILVAAGSLRLESVYLILLLAFFAYCLVDAVSTQRLVSKQSHRPLVGTPVTLVPRFLPNLLFARKAAEILKDGYNKVIT